MNKTILILILMLVIIEANSQGVITLANPSFEGEPNPSTMPADWINCGDENYSPPDMQPGFNEVSLAPNHGNSYLGMVTRSNNTWESICQELEVPLSKDVAYNFSIYLAKSENYISNSELSDGNEEDVNLDRGITLRIWGGNNPCKRKQRLYESTTINHEEWVKYEIELLPVVDVKYITLEAFYKTPIMFEYNGHLLLDNCSKIVMEGYDMDIDTTLNLTEIKEAMLNCNFTDINTNKEQPTVNINLISSILDFEKEVLNNGIRRYIQTKQKEELNTLIKNLEVLNIEETTPMLQKLVGIYNANLAGEEIPNEDLDYFETCEDLFLDVLTKENLSAKVNEYIEYNKINILKEIGRCR